MGTAEIIEFLGSFKNAESMSEDLRDELGVATGLSNHLLAAAKGERIVFVAGTAGSGKTHLLREFASMSGWQVVSPGGETSGEDHVLVIEDATPLSEEGRIDSVNSSLPGRQATIVAINEGPLRRTAEFEGGSIFGDAARFLRKGQRGIAENFDPQLPTVIDMGAFDPLEQGVIAEILGKTALQDVVADSSCQCKEDECSRRLAWSQLQSPIVRDRLRELLKMALLVETDWSFRDVWDFVADLVLAGDCEEDPPTSTWFYRLFFGQSRIATALLEVCEPDAVVLPGIEQRLWYADWACSDLTLVEGVELQVVSKPEAKPERFRWLKLQVLLMTLDDDLHRLLNQAVEHRLERAAKDQETGPIIQAINRYMGYGIFDASAAMLELWVDHSVERRTERAHGQVWGGSAKVGQFTIEPSQVVMNHPCDSSGVIGNDRFLLHSKSKAVLQLSHEKLALLEVRRSFRMADRRHTDLEWDLYSFFEAVLRENASRSEMSVLSCDFETFSGSRSAYTVSLDTDTIEERA